MDNVYIRKILHIKSVSLARAEFSAFTFPHYLYKESSLGVLKDTFCFPYAWISFCLLNLLESVCVYTFLWFI